MTLLGAGHLAHQILALALPFAYADRLASDWQAFARLVLEAAPLAAFGATLVCGVGACSSPV